ncbi:MAG: hypothetical protein HY801_04625 [Candidatus Lindowbacteria bacterium]|nr:hypothetical protein [Candidatus Lindowbacteria bacterium]
MSGRERNRYITTTAVFLLAFGLLGLMLVRSVRVMAQTFTWRPQAGISNTYAGGVASTQRVSFAFDDNLNTAATTYTNADFAGDGATADTVFTFSGRWSAFQQTSSLIRNVGLYVLRESTGNSLDQWKIEYSLTGISGTWINLDNNATTADPIAKGTVSTLTIPSSMDIANDLLVRTTTKQLGTNIYAKLNTYDIRVEADFDTSRGGACPLLIGTISLPDGAINAAYSETIAPSNRNLIAIKNTAYSQTFSAVGGTSPYTWCLVSGSIPPGLSFTSGVTGCTATGSSITLSGTPTNDGVYGFTLRLTDSVPETATATFTLQVKSSGVTLVPTKLNDYVKGINYGTGLTDMVPEFIMATNIDSSGAAGDIYYVPSDPSATLTPLSPLLLNPGGSNSLPSAQSGALRVNIEGTIGITQAVGTYPLEIGIRDPSNPAGPTDAETYNLKVLDRKTLLLKTPPAAVTLPADNILEFLVFGEGGAPSIDPNPGPCTNTVDGKKVAYYNYAWQVTPANASSPSLGTSSGTFPDCGSSQPSTVTITFADSTGAPVTGDYNVTFRAQDVLRRQNPTTASYEFTPVTVRIKVIAPAGQTLEKGTGTGTKLRQEQYR